MWPSRKGKVVEIASPGCSSLTWQIQKRVRAVTQSSISHQIGTQAQEYGILRETKDSVQKTANLS